VPRARSGEATGVIDELLAQTVGFYAGWGLSRVLPCVGGRLVTARGNLDWRGVDRLVVAALCDVLTAPPDAARDLPTGVLASPARLYMRVAVGQHFSGWSSLSGGTSGVRRLVLLRCHAGKRRAGGEMHNAVLLQYRLWRRTRRRTPRRVRDAGSAWPLLGDLHAEIVKRISGG